MHKNEILNIIDKKLELKLNEKISFEEYFERIFQITMILTTNKFNPNEQIKTILKKFHLKIDLISLINTNERLYIKILYIMHILNYFNISSFNLDKYINSIDFELDLYDEYLLINLKKIIKKELSKNELHFLDYINKRIIKMISNIYILKEESYRFIEAYYLFNDNINKEILESIISYFYLRYIETKSINFLIFICFVEKISLEDRKSVV